MTTQQLVYYHPIALGNKKHAFHHTINPLISVMDRTANKWPANIPYENMFPMPELSLACPDFIDTSIERIKQLTTQEGGQQHITILWSGGIDSTFILALMIDQGIAEDLFNQGRLTIGLNAESIRENPSFYDKFIRGRYLECVVQADRVLTQPGPNEVIITGEMADNLVGSLTMKSCVDYYNDFGVVHKPLEQSIVWLSRNLTPGKQVEDLREFIHVQIMNCPVELVTCHDLMWYLNFNLKWQAVNFRIVSHAASQDIGNQLIINLKHFFNTEAFQQWSMHTGHKFTGTSWGDYKMVMKDFIYRVDGDQQYLIHKTKHPSLPALLRYKDTFDFIYKDSNNRYTFTKQPLSNEF